MAKTDLKALAAREEQRRASKEDLLRPRMLSEDVFIEGLQATITIRSLSHAKRKEMQDQCGFGTDNFDGDKLQMLSIVNSVSDPQLTESDVSALMEQDAAVVDEIVLAVSLLNQMGRTPELKKESRPTPNSDSDLSSQNG